MMDPQAQRGMESAAAAFNRQPQGQYETDLKKAIELSLKDQELKEAIALSLKEKTELNTGGGISQQEGDGVDKKQIGQGKALSLQVQAQVDTGATSRQKDDGVKKEGTKGTGGAAAQESASFKSKSAQQSSAPSPIQTWEDFPEFPEYLKYKMK